MSDACRQFPNETCLFGDARLDTGCCEVCKSVAAWAKSKMEYVMVREIHAGQGLYVFPVSVEPTDEDRRQCLLELRIADTSLRDLRQAVNTYLLAAEESWIHARNQCVRVR